MVNFNKRLVQLVVNFNKRFVQLCGGFCGEFQPTCGDICGDICSDICSDIYGEFQPICSDNRSNIYSIIKIYKNGSDQKKQVWDRNTVGRVYIRWRDRLWNSWSDAYA